MVKAHLHALHAAVYSIGDFAWKVCMPAHEVVCFNIVVVQRGGSRQNFVSFLRESFRFVCSDFASASSIRPPREDLEISCRPAN